MQLSGASELHETANSFRKVAQSKRQIKKIFDQQKIHWKFIWKRYVLLVEDEEALLRHNRTIHCYEIRHHTQWTFARRYRLSKSFK